MTVTRPSAIAVAKSWIIGGGSKPIAAT